MQHYIVWPCIYVTENSMITCKHIQCSQDCIRLYTEGFKIITSYNSPTFLCLAKIAYLLKHYQQGYFQEQWHFILQITLSYVLDLIFSF